MHHCLNGIETKTIFYDSSFQDNYLHYYSCIFLKKGVINKPKEHSSFFHQIVIGFLLGDGWLEKRGSSYRLGICLTQKFKDVAEVYRLWFYGLGYIENYSVGEPLRRKSSENGYYQIRTQALFDFHEIYNEWYVLKDAEEQTRVKRIKRVPFYVEELFTPLVIAIWVMGDGSGMRDGGFKLSTHGFTREESQYLCDLLLKHYRIKATVIKETRYTCIRVWTRSTPQLFTMVKPYLLESCYYKFRHVKMK